MFTFVTHQISVRDIHFFLIDMSCIESRKGEHIIEIQIKCFTSLK